MKTLLILCFITVSGHLLGQGVFFEDFSNGIPSTWTQSQGGPQWTLNSTGYLARISWTGGTNPAPSNSLITPFFNLSSLSNANLYFDVLMQGLETDCKPKLTVLYSTNGSVFNLIGSVGPLNVCSNPNLIIPELSTQSIYAPLSPTGSIQLSFKAEFFGQGSIYIDNILVNDSLVVSAVESFEQVQPAIKWNSTLGEVQVEHLRQTAPWILSDIQGRVLQKGSLRPNETLSLHKLPSALYIFTCYPKGKPPLRQKMLW